MLEFVVRQPGELEVLDEARDGLRETSPSIIAVLLDRKLSDSEGQSMGDDKVDM